MAGTKRNPNKNDHRDPIDEKSSMDVNFRRGKRNPFVDVWYSFRRSLTPLTLLPFAIIALGTSVAFLAEPTRLDAGTITLMTACLSGLAIYVKAITDAKNQLRFTSIQDRFEQLEDRAWELHESEERYRIVAEAFGDLLVLRNSKGKITYCNEAYEGLFASGHQASILTNELPDFLQRQLKSSANNTSKKEVCIQFDGDTKWFHWEDVPVRDEQNGAMGTLSVARDITAFKRSQRLDNKARAKAEEASKAKSKFLAMVSHEMRTPLNGIIGMSKLLANTKLDPEQENYAAALTESGENLLELINSMLDLTIIEAGKFEQKSEEFEFSEFMNSATELLSSRAYAKNIDCGLFIDPAIPIIIHADKSRLRQIIFNLAGNAIKFTNKGGIQISCVLGSKIDDETATLQIDVIDSGSGLAPEDQQRIFNEFERVDDEVTRNTDGAGLGLSISKALAQQLGGTLRLRETGETGSTFSLNLPVKLVSNQTGKIQAKDDQAVANQKCLIVSSSRFEAECLAKTICSNGGSTKIVKTLSAAKTHLKSKKHRYSAIFYDPTNRMISKKELASFKANAPKQTKIILMVLPEAKHKIDGLKAHMDGWLIRPVRVESLTKVLAGNNSRALSAGSAMITPKKSESRLAPNAVSILLAEDNDINALLVTSALMKTGARVERVISGKDAVMAFQNSMKDKSGQEFDFILMDMHMPVMDGLTAIEKIRAIQEKTQATNQRIPIFALTADEQAETEKAAIATGADGFLVKPIDPNHLIDIVYDHIRGETKKRA